MSTTTTPPLAHLPWEASAAVPADLPCVRDDTTALTRGQFEDRVEAVAEQLAGLGVRRGSVVAVMLPNRVELLVTLVAAWRLGAAATPVNPALTAAEAGYQIEDSGAVVVVDTTGLDAPDGVRRVAVDDLATAPTGTLPPASTAPEDLALLVYTSGSTGRPKGVMLDHANLEAMTSIMVEALDVTGEDHCLLFLPLFHVNAICVSFLTPFRAGAQLSIMGRFTPEAFLDAVERLRPTYFSGVPTIYSMLLAQPRDVDFSSVRIGICGAAPASRELLAAAEARFGLRIGEGYGLTECTCAATSNPLDGEIRAGTVGTALPGVTVEVMAEDGTILPRGERGEVVIAGPIVMRGYLNRPDATAETIRDGWLHTGDVGVFDDEGYLRIVDRIKDMIIRGGENLYPKEIENVLLAQPGVMEAAVVGAPDPTYGEVPVAYVALYPGAEADEAALLAACRADLARMKVPTAIHVLDALPKNPVGKIDKPALRSLTVAQQGA